MTIKEPDTFTIAIVHFDGVAHSTIITGHLAEGITLKTYNDIVDKAKQRRIQYAMVTHNGILWREFVYTASSPSIPTKPDVELP